MEKAMIDDDNENEQLTRMLPKHRNKSHHRERHRQERKIRREERNKREEEKLIEKIKEREEYLAMLLSIEEERSLFEDQSKVTDEQKFPNEEEDQGLPKKIIKVQHKPINMCTQPLLNEDIMYQEDEQPINIQEYYVDSTSAVNGIKSLSTVEKEKPPLSSLVKSNLSNVASVDKIDLNKITISDDMTKLLHMIKAQSYCDRAAERAAHPPPGTSREHDIVETDASINSHAPIEYRMRPIDVSKTDYSDIRPTMGIDDPRLRRNVTAGRTPMFIPDASDSPGFPINDFSPAAPPQRSWIRDHHRPQRNANRYFRKPQQYFRARTSAIRDSLLPTPRTVAQQRPAMNAGMYNMPQPIAFPWNPRMQSHQNYRFGDPNVS